MPIIYAPDKLPTGTGGNQNEAHMPGVVCVTRRGSMGWVGMLEGGWNGLVGTDKDKIMKAARSIAAVGIQRVIFGSTGASEKILSILHEIYYRE